MEKISTASLVKSAASLRVAPVSSIAEGVRRQNRHQYGFIGHHLLRSDPFMDEPCRAQPKDIGFAFIDDPRTSANCLFQLKLRGLKPCTFAAYYLLGMMAAHDDTAFSEELRRVIMVAIDERPFFGHDGLFYHIAVGRCPSGKRRLDMVPIRYIRGKGNPVAVLIERDGA